MLTFAWRWARVGDRVLVHVGPDDELVPGEVAVVRHLRTSTDLGVRIRTEDGDVVIWPSRLAVHPDPPDPLEPCWRCDRRPGTA